MIKKWFIVLLACIGLQLNAQDLELGKVSIEELKLKQHPKDTSAVAAIIFSKAKTTFKYNLKDGFSIGTEFQVRVKIYKKEGLNWATFKVPFYIGYEEKNDESVQFSDAVTYNLVNGIVEKSKLKSEGNFITKINEYWKEASITLPNVKVGSIIEFKYFLKSENIIKFPSFYFQYEIPVNFAQFTTAIPGFFVYKALVTGFVPIKTVQKVSGGSFSFPNKYDRTRSDYVNFEQVISTYTAVDIPALKPEPYVDNLQNYRASLKHELEKTQFYEEAEKDFSSTWEGVTTSIFSEKEFGQQLESGLFFLDHVKEIIKNDSNTELTTETKMQRIFSYVQQRMNWNNENGYYTDKGVKEAYSNSTGNAAEINFILINMLRIAGVDANPVLVSTVDHGVPAYPNRTGFNYVIAAATIDGKNILLDATNKYAVPDVLPLKLLNWQGRLIRKGGSSEEINLVPKKPSAINHNLFARINPNGKIEGKIKMYYTTTESFLFREKQANQDQNTYLERLENKWNGLEISEYGIEENKTITTQPITEKFDFSTVNHCEIIAGKLYIYPMLFLTSSINPFVQEKRDMPIYFAYPKSRKYNFNLEIPAGYAVESIPNAIRISTQGKEVVFSINSVLVGNTIQIVINEEINGAIFVAEFYPELKSFYQKVIEKQNEKIILSKI
ncbi:DUF3857 domain-containing transglutaminase family protein [Flavobacterium turcicum]|uniref:DUF3857 domain-containing protein n=1 Tax=Flavobacterium turcicum TaxID=2764718 RepID=A0ABR7JGT9_9FLAO|nr:DUF3857 domain-containing transglutaminase family protein [Flavobacterium turcicum]MBC5863682.1 hypothetical protein [Flavobacterium turcicum]NHL02370.1 DUF3857 domain-containing transglutaminase family protein [Flavobacterium turcicum]